MNRQSLPMAREADRKRFALELVSEHHDGIMALKRALKALRRQFGLRCTSVKEIGGIRAPDAGESPDRGEM